MALITRRRQVIDMLTAEKNRLHSVRISMKERVQQHIQWLKEEKQALDQEISSYIKKSLRFGNSKENCSSASQVWAL